MNNRYLFRAKRKNWREFPEENQWIYGYLYGIWERKYILWGMTNEVPNMIEVNPSTICQCTGREGEFEHDIFECDGIRYEIVFDEYDLEWDARSVFDASETISLGEFGKDSYIPLGNSIDNPELLEV